MALHFALPIIRSVPNTQLASVFDELVVVDGLKDSITGLENESFFYQARFLFADPTATFSLLDASDLAFTHHL